MAQKKKQTKAGKPLSPEQYIKQKARNLPIVKCLVNKNWPSAGYAIVLVIRQHAGGHYTFGFYSVDTFCCGVTRAHVFYSLGPTDYEQHIQKYTEQFSLEEIPYEEAHNIIFGAIAFAEEAGLAPCADFALARYVLEEDTEDIPLIEYEFGRKGKHFLVEEDETVGRIKLSIMEKHLDLDEYDYDIGTADMDWKEPDAEAENADPEEIKNYLQGMKTFLKSRELPEEAYTYQHPPYPQELYLANREIEELFYSADHAAGFPKEVIQQLLSLPHDELREDMERIVLYELGRSADGIAPERYDEPLTNPLMHALFFLGELKDPESLPILLEMAKQNYNFYEYYFGDLAKEILEPTLYLVGNRQLDALMEYMLIPGLHNYFRCHVMRIVARTAIEEPARRKEVIDWFAKLLAFYEPNLPKCYCCDGMLVGMITYELLDLKARELLPQISRLYATGLVDEMICGNFQKVEEEMMSDTELYSANEHYVLDIYARYEQMEAFLNR